MGATIISTKTYKKSISKLLSVEEKQEMENEILADPFFWPVIQGAGGIRKARFSRDGMGKSSGGRVCYLYITIHEIIYFIEAYAKMKRKIFRKKIRKQ